MRAARSRFVVARCVWSLATNAADRCVDSTRRCVSSAASASSTSGDRVDLEQQVALGNLDVLGDRHVDDPSADRGRDMDDVGIDRRVIGRGKPGVAIHRIESDADAGGYDQQRDQLGRTPIRPDSRGPHALSPEP